MSQEQKTPRKIRRTGGLRARAWWVLRKNKSMTSLEIQNTVCNGSEKSADSNLRRWLIKLVEIGVLEIEKVDDGKLTSNGSNLYTLVLDLGPVAPIVRGKGQVFNPNTGKVIAPLKTATKDSSAGLGRTNDAVIRSL